MISQVLCQLSTGWGKTEFYLMKAADFTNFKKFIGQNDTLWNNIDDVTTRGGNTWTPTQKNITRVTIKRWVDDPKSAILVPI